ncbi:hypothetical protein CYB_0354 [Synechococcus sp. JA-2-3B'a(2-13)]|nr:hypothetical protein CYB_0354 [Synechococcus sp. JA-2-3B'a(2-13)]
MYVSSTRFGGYRWDPRGLWGGFRVESGIPAQQSTDVRSQGGGVEGFADEAIGSKLSQRGG